VAGTAVAETDVGFSATEVAEGINVLAASGTVQEASNAAPETPNSLSASLRLRTKPTGLSSLSIRSPLTETDKFHHHTLESLGNCE
jgi:hypothetical protein